MLSLPANHENDLYLLLHKCRVQKWLLLTAIGKNLTFIYYQICTFKTTYVLSKSWKQKIVPRSFQTSLFLQSHLQDDYLFFAVYNGKTWLAIVKWYHLLGKIAKLYSQLAQIPKKNGTLHFTSHSILFQAAILFFVTGWMNLTRSVNKASYHVAERFNMHFCTLQKIIEP